MRGPQHTFRLLAGAGAAALALAACGGSGGGLYGSGGGSSPPSSPAASSARIETASVQGVGTVLQSSGGFTLYHYTRDTPHQSTCTGACSKTFPPLLADGGSVPSGMGLPGKLSTIERSDGGTQVAYNGMPLYTYSGDTAPGEANGQGIGNLWFAVAPTGTNQAASAGSMTSGSSSSSGGSGGAGYGGGRYGNGGGGNGGGGNG
jgi:predicted lipoprotein with Yx(FWY)xxD motif